MKRIAGGVVILGLLLAGCTLPGTASTDRTTARITTSASTSMSAQSAASGSIGNVGTAQSFSVDTSGPAAKGTVTVEAIQRAKSGSFEQPKSADGFLVLTVAITADAGQIPVNPLDWTVRDSSGFTYQAALGSVDPQLEANDIPVGITARGLVSFDVPAGAYTAEYRPSMTGDVYRWAIDGQAAPPTPTSAVGAGCQSSSISSHDMQSWLDPTVSADNLLPDPKSLIADGGTYYADRLKEVPETILVWWIKDGDNADAHQAVDQDTFALSSGAPADQVGPSSPGYQQIKLCLNS